MPQFSEIEVEQLDRARRVAVGEPALLIGSAISLFTPTSLPSGEAVSAALFKLLFDNPTVPSGLSLPPFFEEDFNRIPFEALMECYPDQSTLPLRISKLFRETQHNELHSALSMCLVAGAVSAIITTNYDLAFDSCLMPHRHVVTTITEEAESEEFLSGPRHTRAYFKIHGSAEPGKEHTLAFTLGHEGLLDPWKRGLLRELLYGRCLIVLGYSGRDWEICPELARSTQPTAVYWLRRGRSSQAKELSSNARRVLRRTGGSVLRGDLKRFVEWLTQGLLPPCSIAGAAASKVASTFAPDCLAEWRVRVLERLAAPALGLPLLSKLANRASRPMQLIHSHFLAHAGKYYQSARVATSLSKEPLIPTAEHITLLIAAAERWFSYGSYLRSRWFLGKALHAMRALSVIDSGLMGSVYRLRLTYKMRAAQIAKAARFGLLLRHLQRRARDLYRLALEHLEPTGSWDQLQMVQDNAERIGVAVDDRLPLSAADGYRSLGLEGLATLSIRDEFRTSGWRLLPEEVLKLEELVAKSEAYGWHHEAWKNSWILIWRSSRGLSAFVWGRWWRHFAATEYPLSFRLWQMLYSILPRP